MTKLVRPVTRWIDFGRGPIAITLQPDGMISFREQRRRVKFFLPIGAAFVEAVGRAVAAEREAKRIARKASRGRS